MQGIRRLGLVGLGLGLAVSGCGSDEGGSAQASDTSSPSSPASNEPATPPTTSSPSSAATPSGGTQVPDGAPACVDVWQAGEKLPRTYAGCVDGSDYLRRDVMGCSSGQRLVRFADQYYGVLGGTIKQAATTPLVDDAEYRDTVIACRA